MFTYDKENHKGYVDGKLIPSITQLLAIMFPMEDIPSERLEKAAIRGTKVHEDIELFNQGIKEHCETQEGKNYEILANVYGLKVYDSEQQILLTDDQGKIIAYGTLDVIFEITKDTNFANKGELVLSDYKTTAQFINEKVEWQTNFYALGYEELNICKIHKVAGIWLRDDIKQIRPLKKLDRDLVESKLYELVKKWEALNGNTNDSNGVVE